MTARVRILMLALFALTASSGALAGPREEARMLEATQVLTELQAMPDQSMPDWLLARAQGIAVIPSVKKVALVFGGRMGRGIMVVRDNQGRWTNPVFLTLGGGSFGWQAGLQESDIVLVFTTRRGIEGVTGGKLTLGADASVAAGPVGRSVSAATDISGAEIYSYSRAKGLFGGIAIDGSIMSIDGSSNASYYERGGVLASDILGANPPPAPPSAKRLLDVLRELPHGADGVPVTRPAPTGSASSAPASAPPPDSRGLESGGATAYPLNDDKPHS